MVFLAAQIITTSTCTCMFKSWHILFQLHIKNCKHTHVILCMHGVLGITDNYVDIREKLHASDVGKTKKSI